MTLTETCKWLMDRDRYLIITHIRPDGDTLCSAAALVRGLNGAGKTAYLLANPQATNRYTRFMGRYFAPEGYEYEHVISVDTAAEGLFPQGGESYTDKVELAIDHHASNTGYAEKSFVVSEKASCGEIIYDLLMDMNGGIDEETAALLYIAVSTDTGCFVYANTTAETLRTAAELVEAGAPNGELNKFLFRTKAKSRIALETSAMNGIRFYRDGKVAIIAVSRDMIAESGADEDALDDLASVPGQIEGVVVGITAREIGEGVTKMSVRTTPEVSANEICSKFGGGGHFMAAGCTMEKPLYEAVKLIAKAVDEVWK
ncbi:MAG: bifunctional oligoribonuclease/PAP phosphatase NrnA [Oscillospiraceae bacterium]|nr:bifunctional oligoribonuclease/PAP phosphatase NrnA [Oscillospiraceae bacterium]